MTKLTSEQAQASILENCKVAAEDLEHLGKCQPGNGYGLKATVLWTLANQWVETIAALEAENARLKEAMTTAVADNEKAAIAVSEGRSKAVIRHLANSSVTLNNVTHPTSQPPPYHPNTTPALRSRMNHRMNNNKPY